MVGKAIYIQIAFCLGGLRHEQLARIHTRDFKQRQRGRRRERHKIREKPKGPLRMTGGKQVDVLRSGPT